MSDDRNFWWEDGEASVGECVKATIQSIQSSQSEDRTQDLRFLRMYRNRQLPASRLVGNGMSPGEALGAPLSLNVVRGMCDAVTSRIAKNRPKATFQTYGGTFQVREQARRLEKWVEGCWYKEKVRRQTPVSFLDMTVLGTGFMQVLPIGGRIHHERVFPLEITVDTTEGMHRTPRNIYRSRYIDKGILAKAFPDKAAAILALTGDEEETEGYSRFLLPDNRDSNMVLVHNAYHLASEQGADDGKFVQSVQGITLEVKPWKRTKHPFAEMRWSTGQLGYFGMGLAEELQGIQVEINRLVRKIQSAMQILSNPYIFADRASNIAKGSVTDVPGTFIFYTGKEPRVSTPSVVHAEVFAHLDRLYQRSYEIAGVSQLSAHSQKPQGLESGRSILVMEEQDTERFATVGREWDDFHMQIAELDIEAAKELPGYEVPVDGENGYDLLKFSDIKLKDLEYVMRPMATSLLGDTPSGQIDMIERLSKGGLIQSPDDLLREIESPDVKRYLYKVTAPKRVIERIIEYMLNGGEYVSPEPAMNLQLAASEAQLYYHTGLLEGRSRESLANVRKFSLAAAAMAKAAAAPVEGQAMMPSPAALGAPPVMPGAAPAALPMPQQMPGAPQ
jgi:hypothetical protein